jgi:hypothetical protein
MSVSLCAPQAKYSDFFYFMVVLTESQKKCPLQEQPLMFEFEAKWFYS